TVTALVGSSGSGKSTIIGLLSAFYKPQSGRILVDDVDLSHVRLDSYRTKLGVVLQESFLFDGTIRENVAFSRPEASEEEIRRADQILVIESGNLLERGTHEELYERGGRYFELYTKQHGLEKNLFLAPGEGDAVEETAEAQARGARIPNSVDILRGNVS